MKVEDIKNIGIVGAGTMGHGIALSFSLGGYRVFLQDLKDDILNGAIEKIRKALDTFIDADIITREESEQSLQRINTTTNLEMLCEKSDYVCECIVEDSSQKRELFKRLDLFCPPHTILASNTSSLVLSDFGRDVKRQEKIIVTHYFNPPHIVPTVEVVKGPNTSEETFDIAYGLLIKTKKLPVKVQKEIPGYLVNRIQFAMFREVLYLLYNGVASPEDIDRAVKGSFGFRLASIGPLMTLDLSGIPKWKEVAVNMFENAYKFICSDTELPKEAKEQFLQGRGFFHYSEEEWAKIIEKRDKEFLQRLKMLYW
jgi:3-hydroxybutyryl-CoA dehydrogenase